MAYPDPDTLIVLSPTTQRIGEIRLFYGHASGGPQSIGYTQEEAKILERAINLCDPRYGDDPVAAMKMLEDAGFKLYGKLYRRTYSVSDAAIQLHLSDRRIRDFIAEDRLSVVTDEQGEKITPYKIYAGSVLQFEQQERPAHRPKLTK